MQILLNTVLLAELRFNLFVITRQKEVYVSCCDLDEEGFIELYFLNFSQVQGSS